MAEKKETDNLENREYRSDVFSMLMEYPENALSVYNALNNSAIDDPSLVEMTTLERGISLTIRNDASFIIGMNLNIYEHQSTYNPNMPLRSLLYFTDIIKSFVKNADIYGRALVMIPRPHFVVFYNGTEKRQEVEVLRLSDSYSASDNTPELELICTVYNINSGNNVDFMSRCSVLNDYMIFVEKVKEYLRGGYENAVFLAIEYCIEHNILRDFLKERRNEVLKNMTIDMTFERRLEIVKKENYEKGKAEGKAEGIEEGMAKGRAEGKAEGLLEAYNICIKMGMTKEEATRIFGIED